MCLYRHVGEVVDVAERVEPVRAAAVSGQQRRGGGGITAGGGGGSSIAGGADGKYGSRVNRLALRGAVDQSSGWEGLRGHFYDASERSPMAGWGAAVGRSARHKVKEAVSCAHWTES